MVGDIVQQLFPWYFSAFVLLRTSKELKSTSVQRLLFIIFKWRRKFFCIWPQQIASYAALKDMNLEFWTVSCNSNYKL